MTADSDSDVVTQPSAACSAGGPTTILSSAMAETAAADQQQQQQCGRATTSATAIDSATPTMEVDVEEGGRDMHKSLPRQPQQRVPQSPQEYEDGKWEVEPIYYSHNGSNDTGTNAAMGQMTMSSLSQSQSNGPNTSCGPTGGLYDQAAQSTDSYRGRGSKRGLIYKSVAEGDCEYKCFQDHTGAIYRPGDHVFIETGQVEQPFLIGSILLFKMTKKEQLSVKVSRYYRPNDVPELSYSLVIQERKDLGHFDSTLPFHAREVFSSENNSTHSISSLRGKCNVKQVKDIRAVSASTEAQLYLNTTSNANEPVHFFFCLNFNHDSSRLAAVQGEIRVGAAFQAKIPQCSVSTLGDETDRDECLYRPDMICHEKESAYVKMTRTFRTFSLLSNKKITALERASRVGDLLHDDSLVTLHRCGYNVPDAVEMMQANDQHLTNDSSFMSAEDVKRFGKGIRSYGKNFNKISRELLPFHQRDQLVSFYYLWKKSRDATRPRPLTRQRNTINAARSRGGSRQITNNVHAIHQTASNGISDIHPNTTSSPSSSRLSPAAAAECIDGGNPLAGQPASTTVPYAIDELADYASASETEAEQLDGESRACHHCFSVQSRDWHHTGRKRQLMCTDCRLFYKRYGQMRPVDRPSTVPPCLQKVHRVGGRLSSPNDEENEENDEPLGVRTRGAGRKQERRRTPSVYDFNEATEGKVDFRTPTKGELLLGLTNGERRTTPQRNAKNNLRKRTHHGSSNSGGDEQSPLSKPPKRTRPSTEPSSTKNASRTPSPPTESQQSIKKEESIPDGPVPTSIPTGLVDEKLEAKIEPQDMSLLPNGVHSFAEQGSTAAGSMLNSLPKVQLQPNNNSSQVPERKPVAKVGPMLDTAIQRDGLNSVVPMVATRKSGVDGQMELLKKRNSPDTAAQQPNNKGGSTPLRGGKMTAKLARLSESGGGNTREATIGGDTQGSSSGARSVGREGEGERADDSSGSFPIMEEFPITGEHIPTTILKRTWRRMNGLNSCARTDLVWGRRTEHYYIMRRKAEEEARIAMQNQQLGGAQSQQPSDSTLQQAQQQSQHALQQSRQQQQQLHPLLQAQQQASQQQIGDSAMLAAAQQQLEQQQRLLAMASHQQQVLAAMAAAASMGVGARKELTPAEMEQLAIAIHSMGATPSLPNGIMGAVSAASSGPSALSHSQPPIPPSPLPTMSQTHHFTSPMVAAAAHHLQQAQQQQQIQPTQQQAHMMAGNAGLPPSMLQANQQLAAAAALAAHLGMAGADPRQAAMMLPQEQQHALIALANLEQQQKQHQKQQVEQQLQRQQASQQKATPTAMPQSQINGVGGSSSHHNRVSQTPKLSISGGTPGIGGNVNPSPQMLENAQRMQLLGQQQQHLAALAARQQQQLAQSVQVPPASSAQSTASPNPLAAMFGADGGPLMGQLNSAQLALLMNDPQSRIALERVHSEFINYIAQQQQQQQQQSQHHAAMAAQAQKQQAAVAAAAAQQQQQLQEQQRALLATSGVHPAMLAALSVNDPMMFGPLMQQHAVSMAQQQQLASAAHAAQQQHSTTVQQQQLWQQAMAAAAGQNQVVSAQQHALLSQQPQLVHEALRKIQQEQAAMAGGGGAGR